MYISGIYLLACLAVNRLLHHFRHPLAPLCIVTSHRHKNASQTDTEQTLLLDIIFIRVIPWLLVAFLQKFN